MQKTVDAINLSKSGEKLDSKSLDGDSKHSESEKKDSDDEESVEKVEAIHAKSSDDEYLKQMESRTLTEEPEQMEKTEEKDIQVY